MKPANPIRYSRYIHKAELVDRIAKDESFLALRQAAKSGIGYLSLLEKNKIQLNYGTTRIACVEYGSIVDRHYIYHPKTKIGHSLSLGELKKRASKVKTTRPGYLKEGGIQDDICQDGYCIEPQNQKRWLIIDREAVIGFENKEEKRKFRKCINEVVSVAVGKMEKPDEKWCQFKMPGDECDLLAVSEDGELICLEVKYGDNPSLEWAPYQALAYKQSFQKASPIISAGIKEMVRQKIKLGLIDIQAEKYLPSGPFQKIIAAVIVGQIDTASKTKQDRLKWTASAIGSGIKVLQYTSGTRELSSFE